MTPTKDLPAGSERRAGRVKRLFLFRSFLVIVFLMLAGLALLAWAFSETLFAKDENLVRTTKSAGMTPPLTTLSDRVRWKYYEFARKYWPDPIATTFPASIRLDIPSSSLLK